LTAAKFAAVNGQQLAPEQFQLPAQHRELPVHRPQRLEVVLPEVGDGFEVRRQLAQQPDHFHVAMAFGLQQPRGANPMQIAVEIQFEQRRRIVGRTARGRALGLGKTQRVQIQRPDEGVQEAHGVFGGDVILQPFGEEQRLGAVQSGAMIHACNRPTTGVKVQK
jgi:hypothetical protein